MCKGIKLFLYSVGICSILAGVGYSVDSYAQSSYPGLVAPKQNGNKSSSNKDKPSGYKGLFSGDPDAQQQTGEAPKLTQQPYKDIEDKDSSRMSREERAKKKLESLYPQSFPSQQKQPGTTAQRPGGQTPLSHRQSLLENKKLLEKQFQESQISQSYPPEIQEMVRKYMPKDLVEDIQRVAEFETSYQDFLEAQKQIKLPPETLKWLKYVEVKEGEMNPVEKTTKIKIDQLFTFLSGEKDREVRSRNAEKAKGELEKMMDLFHLKRSTPKSVMSDLGMPDNYIDIQYEGYESSIDRIRVAIKALRKY